MPQMPHYAGAGCDPVGAIQGQVARARVEITHGVGAVMGLDGYAKSRGRQDSGAVRAAGRGDARVSSPH